MMGGRLRNALSGGGPISGDVQTFVRTVFGCNMVQGYALTLTLTLTPTLTLTQHQASPTLVVLYPNPNPNPGESHFSGAVP